MGGGQSSFDGGGVTDAADGSVVLKGGVETCIGYGTVVMTYGTDYVGDWKRRKKQCKFDYHCRGMRSDNQSDNRTVQ